VDEEPHWEGCFKHDHGIHETHETGEVFWGWDLVD
jgi:hypothetical protein